MASTHVIDPTGLDPKVWIDKYRARSGATGVTVEGIAAYDVSSTLCCKVLSTLYPSSGFLPSPFSLLPSLFSVPKSPLNTLRAERTKHTKHTTSYDTLFYTGSPMSGLYSLASLTSHYSQPTPPPLPSPLPPFSFTPHLHLPLPSCPYALHIHRPCGPGRTHYTT